MDKGLQKIMVWDMNIVSSSPCTSYLITPFNKIAIQGKGPGGKWTRKPLAEIYFETTLFLNCLFTLLAVTQFVDNLFRSFTVLCEN